MFNSIATLHDCFPAGNAVDGCLSCPGFSLSHTHVLQNNADPTLSGLSAIQSYRSEDKASVISGRDLILARRKKSSPLSCPSVQMNDSVAGSGWTSVSRTRVSSRLAQRPGSRHLQHLYVETSQALRPR